MSLKLRVQVSVGATSRQVEVDRAKPDYNSLRNEVQKKTKQQGQWYLRRTNNKTVNNDAELLEAVVESENSGANYLQLAVVGGSAPQAARPVQAPVHQPQQAYQPPAQPAYQQPTYQPPAQQAYQPPAQPAHVAPPQQYHAPPQSFGGVNNAPGIGTFRVWTVPATPGGDEKPKIIAAQQATYYAFSPSPCSQNITIECFIEAGNALKFKLTLPSGSSMVQTFKMPFDIGCDLLECHGDTTHLNFPF